MMAKQRMIPVAAIPEKINLKIQNAMTLGFLLTGIEKKEKLLFYIDK